ncbi:hypothetical protein KCU65_g14, partial [Aureobasidium melanogenum]
MRGRLYKLNEDEESQMEKKDDHYKRGIAGMSLAESAIPPSTFVIERVLTPTPTSAGYQELGLSTSRVLLSSQLFFGSQAQHLLFAEPSSDTLHDTLEFNASFEYIVQVVHANAAAVVSHSLLTPIVCPDLVLSAHFCNADNASAHREHLLFSFDDSSGRQMGQSDSTVGCVDVLATCSSCAHNIGTDLSSPNSCEGSAGKDGRTSTDAALVLASQHAVRARRLDFEHCFLQWRV